MSQQSIDYNGMQMNFTDKDDKDYGENMFIAHNWISKRARCMFITFNIYINA